MKGNVKIPNRFSATFISRHLFPDYFPNDLPEINAGRCYDWAYFGWRLFPNVQLWMDEYHAWVQVMGTGRHYDSETCYGVKDYRKLPCNIKCGLEDPRPVDVDEFKDFWDCNGGGGQRHWDSKLEKQLLKLAGDLYTFDTPIIG